MAFGLSPLHLLLHRGIERIAAGVEKIHFLRVPYKQILHARLSKT